MSLEETTKTQNVSIRTFRCNLGRHREKNAHSPSGPHYCRNYSPSRENCQYRGNNIPFQTGPNSVGGRAYQCKCKH